MGVGISTSDSHPHPCQELRGRFQICLVSSSFSLGLQSVGSHCWCNMSGHVQCSAALLLRWWVKWHSQISLISSSACLYLQPNKLIMMNCSVWQSILTNQIAAVTWTHTPLSQSLVWYNTKPDWSMYICIIYYISLQWTILPLCPCSLFGLHTLITTKSLSSQQDPLRGTK